MFIIQFADQDVYLVSLHAMAFNMHPAPVTEEAMVILIDTKASEKSMTFTNTLIKLVLV